jgi:glucokinase
VTVTDPASGAAPATEPAAEPERQSPVLAIDIGGTKLAAALVDAAGTVLRRAEVPTPVVRGGNEDDAGDDDDAGDGSTFADLRRAETPNQFERAGNKGEDESSVADALIRLAREVCGDQSPSAVGLASAGPLDLIAGTASPVNIPSWRAFPLRDTVAGAFAGVQTVMLGDAVAAAAGEHWRGAGRGAEAMLGIVVSTGVGGGLVLDGRAYSGPTGNAGHFGHIPTDLEPVPCACGMTGCVEALASGPSMVRWALRQGWRADGEQGPAGADARTLAEDARAGDSVALAAFDRAADALACGIVGAAALLDLDLVVIGGGVAAAGAVLLDPLRAHLRRRASLDFVKRVQILPGALGRNAGLIGAARAAQLAVAEAGR